MGEITVAKKKMTKAQAASARREQTTQSMNRARAKKHAQETRQAVQEAQQTAKEKSGTRLLIPVVVIVLVLLSAAAFTFLPGMLMNH